MQDSSIESFKNSSGIFLGTSSGVCHAISNKIILKHVHGFPQIYLLKFFLGFLMGFYREFLQGLHKFIFAFLHVFRVFLILSEIFRILHLFKDFLDHWKFSRHFFLEVTLVVSQKVTPGIALDFFRAPGPLRNLLSNLFY